MIRDFFNWAAGQPSSQYTLGSPTFHFNRAARLVERVVSVPALVVGAGLATLAIPGLIAGAPVGASLLTAGLLVAGFGKAVGLVKGGITHLVAKGASSLVNHLSRPTPPQYQPQPAQQYRY